MLKFICSVCLIIHISSDCFPSYNAEPVQGGKHDQDNEVLWQVSFQTKGKRGAWRNICGGSIVSSQHVVTAAHCFVLIRENETQVWDERNETRIVIGTNDLNSPMNPGFKMRIDKVIIPKAYTRLGGKLLIADIAVIRLKHHIDLSINGLKYSLIDLFDPKDKIEKTKYDDQEGFIAGFGSSKVTCGADGKATHSSDGLRNIWSVYFTNYTCPKVRGLRCIRYVKSGVEPKGACSGDSGGPLYYKNHKRFELVGVISAGPRDCDMREVRGKVEKVMFIPGYKNFLDKATILNTTLPKMSIEEFKKSGVGYIVLPDQAELARKYYTLNDLRKKGDEKHRNIDEKYTQ